VTIVDNGSGNVDLVREIAGARESVEVLAMSANVGIAQALNVGVQRVLERGSTWVLTMDQDTVLHQGAVSHALSDAALLPDAVRDHVGVVALRATPQPSTNVVTRYAERRLVLGSLGEFVVRRRVITSGNLVAATVLRQVRYDDRLFIDQVDFAFCEDVRRRGYIVLLHRPVSMEHVLGVSHRDGNTEHPYENAQRVYYIVRNSTYLVVRRRLGVRYYVAQLVAFYGAFVSVNGVSAIGLCLHILLRGLYDGLLARMGRREYPFLRTGRAR
jgi:rhamnosyltransferase